MQVLLALLGIKGLMMKRMFFGLSIALLMNVAYAGCSEISNAINTSLKNVAGADAEGFSDNSAPRATMRNSKMTAELAQVQVLVAQMQALKCPASQEPYTYSKYSQAAYGCALASSKENCDKSNWKPFFKAPD